ncbi:MAG: glycerol-3-phosphate acyltransferase [Chloroflexi bacterium]|nr:glycerol-3-phosphate acyltransferase [Chloroflexota bacterium]
MSTQIALVLIISYLLGSFPSAYLVAQFIGKKEIWRLGDGNMGAKNAFLMVGRREGILVGVVDIMKGALAVELARFLDLAPWGVYLAGALAVIGHDFSLFVGFRGGQGMATMVGVFGMIAPLQTTIGFVLFIIALFLTRHWDKSCAIGFGSFAGLVWVTGGPAWYLVLLLPTIGLKKLLQNWRARHAVA